MKLYEGMFLFDTNLATKDWPGLERHVQEIMQKNSATLVYSEKWPDRKLSYEIRGCKKGTYYLTYFRAPPESVHLLVRDCELSERVLRLFVLSDEEVENDCQKRVSKEVTGSPEEIEDRRERARREAEGLLGPAPAPVTHPAPLIAGVLAHEEIEEPGS